MLPDTEDSGIMVRVDNKIENIIYLGKRFLLTCNIFTACNHGEVMAM
jgi:hypothetical protein